MISENKQTAGGVQAMTAKGRLRSRTTARALLVLAGLSAGCITPSSSDKGSGSDDGAGDGADGGGTTPATIYDIQQGNVEVDSQVSLSRVIVTSPLTLDGEGFFISEAEGGEYSGVYVFLGTGGLGELFLSVGDELSLTGVVSEFYDYTELTVSSDSITVTGTGTVAPTPVDSPSDWEPYEGVLVSLSAQSALECPDSYGETALSGGIALDDLLYRYESERGAEYSEVVGLVSYGFEEYKLNPRGTEDLAGYVPGEGCTATVAECQQDGITGSVDLEGVVVTSQINNFFGFYVQDQGGGEYSGIYVFSYEDVAAELDIAVGDTVNLHGSVSEYYDFTEISLTSVDDLVKVATAEPVSTELVEAPADWEPYEGGLLTLRDVEVTGDIDSHGQVTTNYGVVIDNDFYDYDLSSGDVLPSVTGLLAWSFDAWHLNPRGAEDVTGGGGGGGTGTVATIAEIQSGGVTGTVTLEGVTVVSGMTAGDGFFVQDDAGAYNGIYVYVGSSGITVNQGDQVTLTGDVSEFYDLTEIAIFDAADLTVTGTGVPSALVLSSEPADWEPYEGVLVSVLADLTLTSDADEFGVCTTSWTSLQMDDALYDFDATYGDGEVFSLVTGPITYDHETWRILPRESGDLAH